MEERTASTASAPWRVACDEKRASTSAHGGEERERTHENTVVSDGVSSTLGVTESGNTGVETETVGKDVLDLVGSDGVEEAVVSSLGDDDDRLTLALVAVLYMESRSIRRLK